MATHGLIWLWQNPAGTSGTPTIAYPEDFPGLPAAGATPRQEAQIINNLLAGRLNAVITVTVAPNAMASVVTDPRIGPNSWFWLSPTTASAAAELGAGPVYILSRGKQTATIFHTASPSTDRTYRMLIVG